MAKLTLLFVAVFAFAIGFHHAAENLDDSQKKEEHDKAEASEEDENSRAAYAKAKATAFASSSGPTGRFYPPNKPLVQCYSCTDCPRVLQNTTVKMCPRTLDPYKQSTCVVFVEHYKHMRKNWYVRGCATERGSCADIRQEHGKHAEFVKLLSCDECEGDKCNVNGSSRSLSDLTIAILTLTVPFALKSVL